MAWDYASVVNVLLGGVVAGASAILAQSFNAKKQLELQQRQLDAATRLQQAQNERIDAGVRGQVIAMLADLCEYVQVGWNFGFVDLNKFGPSLTRLLSRLEAPDVSIAFADERTRSLVYEVVYRAKLAYDFILQNQTSWNEGDAKRNGHIDGQERDHRATVYQGALEQPFRLFLSLWQLLGVERLQRAMTETEKQRTNREARTTSQ